MKNVIAKRSLKLDQSEYNDRERYETIKLNTSTLNKIVSECYRHDGFSWMWRHTNDFVQIFATCGKTLCNEHTLLYLVKLTDFIQADVRLLTRIIIQEYNGSVVIQTGLLILVDHSLLIQRWKSPTSKTLTLRYQAINYILCLTVNTFTYYWLVWLVGSADLWDI